MVCQPPNFFFAGNRQWHPNLCLPRMGWKVKERKFKRLEKKEVWKEIGEGYRDRREGWGRRRFRETWKRVFVFLNLQGKEKDRERARKKIWMCEDLLWWNAYYIDQALSFWVSFVWDSLDTNLETTSTRES